MLALYRDGRQVDALRVYQGIRKLIDEELGLEPTRGRRSIGVPAVFSDPRKSSPLSRTKP